MTTVPVIDYASATPGQLVDDLVSSSCVFLVNHPLDQRALAGWLSTATEFFGLDDAEKSRVQWSGEGPWRGWQPVYAGGPQAMLLERFEVNLARGGQGNGADWADTFELWPERPAGMKAAWTCAYASLRAMASELTTKIAHGLGLPEQDLPAWTDRQHSNLVVNHYLAQTEAPNPGHVRQRPHTDIGGITLLWADDSPGGLEAQIGPEGEWVPVRFPAGALLLQAGDLLHLWSRGRIPANNHRVVNPARDEAQAQRARYSAVFFHHPDVTTWIAPALPDADGPAPGVDALEHILGGQKRSAEQDATPVA